MQTRLPLRRRHVLRVKRAMNADNFGNRLTGEADLQPPPYYMGTEYFVLELQCDAG